MVHLILAAHGTVAQGILSGAELICGKQKNISTISLMPSMGAEMFGMELQKIISSIKEEDEVLILTDIIGGTPTNQAIRKYANNKRVSIVTGLNLAMLLEAIFERVNRTAEETAEICEKAGKDGIINLKSNLSTIK
jgi:mannose/fructose/sorbose-specific phosphotransferase system IIA component